MAQMCYKSFDGDDFRDATSLQHVQACCQHTRKSLKSSPFKHSILKYGRQKKNQLVCLSRLISNFKSSLAEHLTHTQFHASYKYCSLQSNTKL